MLSTLPPELLSQVAFWLVLETCAPPVPLLCASQALYTALSPASNPNLYASVFRAHYDVDAPTRRLALGTGDWLGENEDLNENEDDEEVGKVGESSAAAAAAAASSIAAGKLRSRQLTDELRTRTRALTRLAAAAEHSPEAIEAEDLWIVYMMLIENDNKNITHLAQPLGPGPGVDMTALTTAFHEHTLFPLDRYPPDRAVDALAMWVAWLLDDYSTRRPHTLRSLRPYVFAAHVYELFLAPWTLLHLPTGIPSEDAPRPAESWVADRVPRARTSLVRNYGRTLRLGLPALAHAAMLRFFGGPQDKDDPSSASSELFDVGVDVDIDSDGNAHVSTADLRALPRPALRSESHDADYARLVACHDGAHTPGRPASAWAGVFAGAWEGTFTFLDYDAFRDMLLLGSGSGGTKAVYSGAYGEQAQVWKLRETWVRPRRSIGASTGASVGSAGRIVESRGLRLHGPMTNAGFPPLRAFALDPISGRAPGISPEDATIDDALARKLEALTEYEVVPESELPAALAEADAAWVRNNAAVAHAAASKGKGKGKGKSTDAEPGCELDTGLSLLVTGVGHSAWGRFIISGHVRVWDGLLYLVKEYTPDQRGKWMYRGYVVGDDIMVGRWRDTATGEEYVGYEGTFILNRR